MIFDQGHAAQRSFHRIVRQADAATAEEARECRPDISRHRRRWRTYQRRVDPSCLLFLDETWIETNMTRLHGWVPRGERLIDKVPHGKWKTATFLAALRNNRVPKQEFAIWCRPLRPPPRPACLRSRSAPTYLPHAAPTSPG
jgi:hypothetical protein